MSHLLNRSSGRVNPSHWQIWARIASNSASSDARHLLSFRMSRYDTTIRHAKQHLVYFHSHLCRFNRRIDRCPTRFLLAGITYRLYSSIHPMSYFTVTVTNPQGEVDILTAIDDTWTAQQPNTQTGAFDTAAGSTGFTLCGKNSYIFSEINQQAGWGNTILAATRQSGVKTSSRSEVPVN